MSNPEKSAQSEQRANTLAEYGWSQALLNSDKELKHLFNKAVHEGWMPARFTAELRDTKWFKKHSEAWRTNETLRTVDHGEWKAQRDQKRSNLADMASRIGAVLSEKQLNRIAENVMSFGWDDSQIHNALAGYVKIVDSGSNKGQYIGEAGRNAEALRATARANGYTIGNAELSKWNKAIAGGSASVDDYQGFMRRQAALSFPSFATELNAGADMMEIANPYINSMAQTLEMDPETIDLQDPTIRKALASKNEKTGKPEAMAMYDFEDALRKDSRWQFTDNAKTQASSMALNIGRLMGVSA